MLKPKPSPVVTVVRPTRSLEAEESEAALRRKHNAERADWQAERDELKAANATLRGELEDTQRALRKALNRVDTLEAQARGSARGVPLGNLPGINRARKSMEAAVAAAEEKVGAMAARLEASRYRRSLAMQVLAVLVATEDNPRLTDAQYDLRMEAVLRRARLLLSLDRPAREEEASLLREAAAPTTSTAPHSL